jgi:hypothetical protein
MTKEKPKYKRVNIRFRKPCRICGKMFRPVGIAETLCDKCYYISQRKNVRGRVIRKNKR